MRAVNERRKTPWHLWVIGIVTLLWNAIGVFDYLMTQTIDVARLQQAGMQSEDLARLAQTPWWVNACWALGVWGALLGSILLLARSRRAVTGYVVSLIGIVPMIIYQFPWDRMGGIINSGVLAYSIVVVVLAIAQFWYALRMRTAGVLR